MHKVIVDEADQWTVVPDESLLAIGRKGQNVRLASQLTGWRLDIISESKFQQMEEEALVQLREIEGLGEDLAKSMYRLGFRALEEVAEAAVEELVTIPGFDSAERAEEIKRAAEAAMERVRQDRIGRATSRPAIANQQATSRSTGHGEFVEGTPDTVVPRIARGSRSARLSRRASASAPIHGAPPLHD